MLHSPQKWSLSVVKVRCGSKGDVCSSQRLNSLRHSTKHLCTSSPERPRPLSCSFQPSWPADTRGLSGRAFYPGWGQKARSITPPVDNANPLQAKERTHLVMGKSLGFREEHSFTHVAVVISQEVLQQVCITLHSCSHKCHF